MKTKSKKIDKDIKNNKGKVCTCNPPVVGHNYLTWCIIHGVITHDK